MTIFADFQVSKGWYSKYVLGKPSFKPRAQLTSGCLDPEAAGRLWHVPKCYAVVPLRTRLTSSYTVTATMSSICWKNGGDAQVEVPRTAVQHTVLILVVLIKRPQNLGMALDPPNGGVQFYIIPFSFSVTYYGKYFPDVVDF